MFYNLNINNDFITFNKKKRIQLVVSCIQVSLATSVVTPLLFYSNYLIATQSFK